MTTTASESLIADEWLVAILSADATISAAVGARIYSEMAPEDAIFPCIIFSMRPTARDVMGVGPNRIMAHLVYSIQAVGQYESYSPLQAIADRIDVLLHGAKGNVASGAGSVLGCVRDGELRYPEVEDGVQYRHLGGLYRIMAQKAS